MTYKVVVTTCSDCAILVEARCTNRDLGRWEKALNQGFRGEELEEFTEGMDIGEWVPRANSIILDEPIPLHW